MIALYSLKHFISRAEIHCFRKLFSELTKGNLRVENCFLRLSKHNWDGLGGRVFLASFCENFRGLRKIFLLQFFKYQYVVWGILFINELRKIKWKRNFDFLPPKKFRAFRSQNFFQKIFLTLGGYKKNLRQK